MAIREIVEAIQKNDNYLITSHVNVEGDAIGSELAVFYLVKQLGKNALVVNCDAVPDRYRFLPGWDKVIIGNGAVPAGYNSVIVVDCPTLERTGGLAPLISRAKVKINIDHHVSNKNFADFNWVEPEASSCGEMVFGLYRHMGLNINEDIATMIYVAILTDTGSFRYDSTKPETHRIAGELIKLGVHPPKIAERIYETKSLGDIELLSRALSTLTVSANGKIAYMYVTRKMFHDTGMAEDRTDGFVNYAREIGSAEIAIFFRESLQDRSTIHIGFRSKGRANVNVLAGKFDGGGHPKASGCRLKGGLEDIIKKVVTTAEEFLV